MRAGLGLVVLLVALAVVAGLAMKSTRALTHPSLASTSASAGAVTAASGTPRQQALQIETQVRDAVGSSRDEAEARQQQAEKP